MSTIKVTDFDPVGPELLPDDAVLYAIQPSEATPALIDRKYTWLSFKNWLKTKLALEVGVTNTKRPGADNTIIPHFISEAYTNLILDPTDLTTVNWAKTGMTAVQEGEINGLSFTKLTTDASGTSEVTQVITVTSGTTVHFRGIVKRGSSNSPGPTSSFLLTIGGFKASFNVRWETKEIFPSLYGDIDYEWLDGDTISFDIISLVTASTVATLEIDAGGGLFTSSIYVTGLQVVDDTATRFPFVEGTHLADDDIEVSFFVPDTLTFDTVIDPKFNHASTTGHRIWNISGTQYLTLRWSNTLDYFYIDWNGVTLATLQMDDGTTYLNLNQKLRIIGSLDLSSGGINDSRLILISLEGGVIYEYTVWSGTPAVKTALDMYALDIGNYIGGNLADCEYHYLRFYSGLLVGAVTSSADVDVLLQQKSMILEAIPDAFIPREIPVDAPISSTLQQIANDMRTGQGIQDKAILDRHLPQSLSEIASPEFAGITLDGKTYESVPFANNYDGEPYQSFNHLSPKIMGMDATHFITYTGANTHSLIALEWDGSSFSTDGSLTVAAATDAEICKLDDTHFAFFDGFNKLLTTYSYLAGVIAVVGTPLLITGAISSGLATLDSSHIAVFDPTSDTLTTYYWNGSIWVSQGTPFYVASLGYTNLCSLDSSRIILLDNTNELVQTYLWNGSIWVKEGTDYSFDGIVNFNATAVRYNDNTIFLLRYTAVQLALNQIITMRRYGTVWEKVGPALTIPERGTTDIALFDDNHLGIITTDDSLVVMYTINTMLIAERV